MGIHYGPQIVFFTDGMTEARDAGDEEYGEERLIAETVANRTCSAPALEARLSQAVARFCGDQLTADATLIVVAIG